MGRLCRVAVTARRWPRPVPARHNARMAEPVLNFSPSPGDEVKATTCVRVPGSVAQRREGRRT